MKLPVIATPNSGDADADDQDGLDHRDHQPHDDVQPMSCQRFSGVAARRLRMSFWRSATSGTAAKMPGCMSAIPRMLGTRVARRR